MRSLHICLQFGTASELRVRFRASKHGLNSLVVFLLTVLRLCLCCVSSLFLHRLFHALRKHAYSNILKILPQKIENFPMKNSGSFHISSQNIECGYSLEPPQRGGSNEYPQSMFLSRYMKINVYPCKPQFYYIKMGFKWGQNCIGMFS